MRRENWTEQSIADHFGIPLEEAQIALAGLRTRLTFHRRRTLNVGLASYRAVENEKLPHEATWQTMDRLLTELEELRRRVSPRKRHP
jgi:hypothetical protein